MQGEIGRKMPAETPVGATDMRFHGFHGDSANFGYLCVCQIVIPLEEKYHPALGRKECNSLRDCRSQFLPVEFLIHRPRVNQRSGKRAHPVRVGDFLVPEVVKCLIFDRSIEIGAHCPDWLPICPIHPHLQEDVLDNIFGLRRGADKTEGKPTEGGVIGSEERLESELLAGADARHQVMIYVSLPRISRLHFRRPLEAPDC